MVTQVKKDWALPVDTHPPKGTHGMHHHQSKGEVRAQRRGRAGDGREQAGWAGGGVCVYWTSAAPTHRRAVGWKGNPPVSPGESPAADRPRFLLCTIPAQPVVREHAPGARANTRRPAPSSAKRELGETQRPGSTHSSNGPDATHLQQMWRATCPNPHPPHPAPLPTAAPVTQGWWWITEGCTGWGDCWVANVNSKRETGRGGPKGRGCLPQTKLNCKGAAPPTHHAPPLPPIPPLPSDAQGACREGINTHACKRARSPACGQSCGRRARGPWPPNQAASPPTQNPPLENQRTLACIPAEPQHTHRSMEEATPPSPCPSPSPSHPVNQSRRLPCNAGVRRMTEVRGPWSVGGEACRGGHFFPSANCPPASTLPVLENDTCPPTAVPRPTHPRPRTFCTRGCCRQHSRTKG